MVNPSPFEQLGGAPAIMRLVDTFYDLVEDQAAYHELRLMHGADLTPMRRSLAGFLTGWMGGPRDWFKQNPGKCMISMHAALPITPVTAAQWVDAMRTAMESCQTDPKIAARLGGAFEDLAARMTRLPA